MERAEQMAQLGSACWETSPVSLQRYGQFINPVSRRQRRKQRKNYLRRWPRLIEFIAPALETLTQIINTLWIKKSGRIAALDNSKAV